MGVGLLEWGMYFLMPDARYRCIDKFASIFFVVISWSTGKQKGKLTVLLAMHGPTPSSLTLCTPFLSLPLPYTSLFLSLSFPLSPPSPTKQVEAAEEWFCYMCVAGTDLLKVQNDWHSQLHSLFTTFEQEYVS